MISMTYEIWGWKNYRGPKTHTNEHIKDTVYAYQNPHVNVNFYHKRITL